MSPEDFFSICREAARGSLVAEKGRTVFSIGPYDGVFYSDGVAVVAALKIGDREISVRGFWAEREWINAPTPSDLVKLRLYF